MSFKIKKALCDDDFLTIEKNAGIIWNEHYKNILSKEQIDYMIDKFQSFSAMKNQVEKEGYEYYILYDDCFIGYVGIKIQTEKFAVTHLLARNPYDLSGGEQQRCAIIKLLLNNPQIILMDEPTKGMDAVLKQQFCEIIAELKKEGRTVVIVTHDLEFAARVSDRCGLLFSGEIVSIQSSNSFFSGNKFYTTSAHRISSGIFSNAVLCEEVVELCLKGEGL